MCKDLSTLTEIQKEFKAFAFIMMMMMTVMVRMGGRAT